MIRRSICRSGNVLGAQKTESLQHSKPTSESALQFADMALQFVDVTLSGQRRVLSAHGMRILQVLQPPKMRT